MTPRTEERNASPADLALVSLPGALLLYVVIARVPAEILGWPALVGWITAAAIVLCLLSIPFTLIAVTRLVRAPRQARDISALVLFGSALLSVPAWLAYVAMFGIH